MSGVLLEFVALFATVSFLTYVIMIYVPFARRRPTVPGRFADFEWHLFIPCRDEQAVIATTIAQTRRDFPDAHLWVIDDDSDDSTTAIVRAHCDQDPNVHLVQRRRPDARTGKGHALNAAYAALHDWLPRRIDRSRLIVGVVDADGRLKPDALDYVAAPSVFGDSGVGAAQVAVRMENRHTLPNDPSVSRLGRRFAHYLVRMQDLEFMTTMAAMQMLREHTGTVGMGGNGQFTRLSVLDAIAAEHRVPWHGALLEDYELGLHVLLAGYRNRYVFDTHVEQEGLLSFRRLLAQRTRWTQGTMQCSSYLPQVLRSPHLSGAGVVESSYFLITPWFQVLGVLLWPFLLGSAAWQAAHYVSGFGQYVTNFWPLLVLILLFGVAPFAIWGPALRRSDRDLSLRHSLLLGLGNTFYVYYTYVTTLRALARMITGRRGWTKTRRNAEILVATDA